MDIKSWTGSASTSWTPTLTQPTSSPIASRYPLQAARPLALAAIVLACVFPSSAWADCFDDAARHHNVNPWILRAIAAVESSFNPLAKHPRNSDGSQDEGVMGINSVHGPDLARYGVTSGDMRDGCKSVFLGGWHLRNKINERGNTWEAIGTYHSKTPSKRDAYAQKVQYIIEFWTKQGIIPR